jgi:hypothetical protein
MDPLADYTTSGKIERFRTVKAGFKGDTPFAQFISYNNKGPEGIIQEKI